MRTKILLLCAPCEAAGFDGSRSPDYYRRTIAERGRRFLRQFQSSQPGLLHLTHAQGRPVRTPRGLVFAFYLIAIPIRPVATMAAAVQATPQPLTESADSVHSSTAAPMTTQSSSGSCPPKGEDENNTAPRSSQTSSNAKHAKRHGNQPILVWLQRKIGGKGNSIKKRQTSELPGPNTTLAPGAVESSDSATIDHSPKGTVRASRKHRELDSSHFRRQNVNWNFPY
jgi:hypothetical protein